MIDGGPVGGGEMTVKLTDFGIARARRADADHPGRLGGRHRRLPRPPSRCAARRRPRRPTSTRSASSSTSSSPGACPTRARPSPSWRCASRTSVRCPPPPTTRRCPRPSAPRCCAPSRGTPRAATRAPTNSPAGLQRGLQGEDVTLPDDVRRDADVGARLRDRDPPPRRDRADRVPAGPVADEAAGGARAAAARAAAARRAGAGRRPASAGPSRASCAWCWRWSRSS